MRVSLEIEEVASTDAASLAIQARVAGAESGMTYKWFSTNGEFIFQEPNPTSALFKFGPGMTADQVSFEVWQNGHRVARSQIEVRPPKQRPPVLQIQVTEMPPHDPEGRTRVPHTIAGRILGDANPHCLVVVYCRNKQGIWSIQPHSHVKHVLRPDLSWSTSTVGGPAYAILLVEPTYVAPFSTGALPPLGGGVVARAIIDGRRE